MRLGDPRRSKSVASLRPRALQLAIAAVALLLSCTSEKATTDEIVFTVHRHGAAVPAPPLDELPIDPLQQKTELFLQSYGCNSAFRDAVNEYGVGDATYERSIVLPAETLPLATAPPWRRG